MKKTTLLMGTVLMTLLSGGTAKAQLSTNPDKFLGNITTRGSVNGGGYEYKTKWNQMTCENETKWSSVQGGGANSWNWGGADNAYNYCKNNNLLFKFHCLVWGSQYPSWIESLTPEDRYKAIEKWMDAVKKRYPDLKMFDVVNEAIQGHQQGTPYFEAALGGKGVSGWDWIIKAFEMAHERWPDAILIYNDFNTFQWQRSQFIELVTALRDYGAPIDAYGCQSHDLTGYGLSSFKQAMDEIQGKLKMPMYSTEYDIGTEDDNQQLTNYKEQIPYMWEKDYFAGLTLWGSTYGATWTDNGNSGILKGQTPRPAYTWLVEYMKTDAAKNAKSPFPGMKKQVDFYIKPSAPRLSMAEEGEIDLRARMIDKTRKIASIDFYANNQLYCTLTEAPWVVKYTPGKIGNIPLKAVLHADDGAEYVRYGSVNVVAARSPYGTYYMPGLVQAECFDKGVEGSAYHDSDYSSNGSLTSYRTDTGVDFASGNSGKVVSNTETGEWLEYTINVKEDGLYAYEFTASSGVDDAAISLSVKTDSGYVALTNSVAIPCAKLNSWVKYNTVYGRMLMPLKAGKQIFRLNIDKGGAYVDKMKFTKIEVKDNYQMEVKVNPEVAYEKDTVKISVKEVSSSALTSSVSIYINNVLEKKLTAAPFEYDYVPTKSGDYTVMAYATDEDNCVSLCAETQLKVEKKRIPYKEQLAVIPGVIEAENFDHMGEGYSFHDTDLTDEGASKYRTDNEGVDIYKGGTGYVIGSTAKGEWLDYSVDVEKAGIYDIVMTVSTNTEKGIYKLYYLDEDGKKVSLFSGQKTIAAYKNWDTYKEIKTYTYRVLPAGKQVLRLEFLGPFNIDKMTFTYNEEKTAATAIEEATANQVAGTYKVYSLTGAYLGQFTAEEGDNLCSKLLELTGKKGSYVIKRIGTDDAKVMMAL